MATAQLGYFSTRGSCMTWQQSVASFRWCVLVSSSITWVEMAVFDLKLGLVVVRNVFPCGQEHLSLCGWRDTIAECGKDREHRLYITIGNMYARQWKHLSRFPAAAPEHQLPAAGSCPAARPHQEAPRGERPAGFHRINKTVTHKDRRRKGQTLVHNRRATARPKELSECSWRTDSHTQTHTDIYVKLVHVLILTSVCVFDVSLVFKLWSEEIYPRDTHPSCHPLQTACWWGTGSWSRIRQCCS